MYAPLEGLREYQVETCAAVIDALCEGYKRILYTAATSTGKTVTFSALTRIFRQEYDWNVLILAHRKELIDQAYCKVQEYCDLEHERDIDKEMGEFRFNPKAPIIVGSVQTCYRETRLQGWTPNAIIVDEAHLSRANGYDKIFKRFPDAVIIGCTATAKRLDKQSLYAISANEPPRGVKYVEVPDGYQIITRDPKTRRERPIEREEAVYEKLVFEYSMLEGVEDGYLVEPEQVIVHSDVDISDVAIRQNRDGDVDLVESQLQAKLEATKAIMVYRINLAYQAWEQCASDLPTVIFAPSVKYAREAAAFWYSKGHAAQAIDGESESRAANPDTPWIPSGAGTREKAIRDIRSGAIQVTANCGIYTAGTDIDIWSCAVLLRPTSSWALYNQMAGRIGRPLAHIAKRLAHIATGEERKALIAASDKPRSIIIDVVDLCKSHSLCTMPAIMDLPCDFDLAGGSITEAAKMLGEYSDVAEAVLGECPMTLQDLKVRLERVRMLSESGSRSRGQWGVAEDGSYRHRKLPPGYMASLEREGATKGQEQWRMRVVDATTGEIVREAVRPRKEGDVAAYFDSADAAVQRIVEQHRKEHPRSTGMLQKLRNAEAAAERAGKKDPRLFYLRKAGFSDEGINTLHDKQVRAIVNKEREKYWAAKEAERLGQTTMRISA